MFVLPLAGLHNVQQGAQTEEEGKKEALNPLWGEQLPGTTHFSEDLKYIFLPCQPQLSTTKR